MFELVVVELFIGKPGGEIVGTVMLVKAFIEFSALVPRSENYYDETTGWSKIAVTLFCSDGFLS